MVKKYYNFLKESVENRGVGPGNSDMFPSSPKKQTINKNNPTMDFLRVGKHIKTNKIDGFIDSIESNNIYILDGTTGEIKRFSIKDVLKNIILPKENNKEDFSIKGFKGTPLWLTKQKIYEKTDLSMDDLLLRDEPESFDIDDEFSDIIIDDDDDETYDSDYNNDINIKDLNYSNAILYVTEDDPEGKLKMKVLERYSNNNSMRKKFYNEEESEEENEDSVEIEGEVELPLIRGTEDNPISFNKKNKIKII